ncbi:hypothetical protein LguiA_016974 [Lonicera macranthoides]
MQVEGLPEKMWKSMAMRSKKSINWDQYGVTSPLHKARADLRRINLDGLRWRAFDAKGQLRVSLGGWHHRYLTVIHGKDYHTYAPNLVKGDMCIVLNAKDVCVTGRKLTDKFYRWHTGQDRDRKLRIFAGSQFGDRPVKTYVMPPRRVREMHPLARRAMIQAQQKADQQ